MIVDSMFHTDIEQNPWWSVDLQGLYDVKEVIIYNRNHDCNDSCQARANGAIISLIDDSGRVFDTRDIGDVAQTSDPMKPIGLPFAGVPIGSYLSLAKKIKIQLTDTDYLHLNEVQVFDEAGVNRALDKPSTMSSMSGSFSPDMAVDGITSGANYFQTDIEFGAWWELDLLDIIQVKQIVLYNRQDCTSCQARLSNAFVSLIDSTGTVYDKKNVGDTAGVSQIVLNFNEIKKSVLPPKEFEPVSRSLFISMPPHSTAKLANIMYYTNSLDTLNTLVLGGAEILRRKCMITCDSTLKVSLLKYVRISAVSGFQA